MGSNQSKKSNLSTYANDYTNTNHNGTDHTSDSLLRLKRRKSNSSTNLNRSSSSPVINPKIKAANLENYTNNHYNRHQQNSSNLTSSKSSFSTNTYSTPSPRMPLKENFVTEPKRFTPRPPNNSEQTNSKPNIIDHNKQMRNNQQQLNKIIKQSDGNQPSYHLSSKLYKPKSLIAPNQNVSVLKNNSQSNVFIKILKLLLKLP